MVAGKVMIIDADEVFSAQLAVDFGRLGYLTRVVREFCEARSLGATELFELVVSELKLPSGTWFERVVPLMDSQRSAAFIVVTACGSIATAVKAVRLGARGYLSKPVTAQNILDTLEERDEVPPSSRNYCSLDRAKWEYIQMTVSNARTLTEAARRLGVDLRSLRRMLLKHAPSR